MKRMMIAVVFCLTSTLCVIAVTNDVAYRMELESFLSNNLGTHLPMVASMYRQDWCMRPNKSLDDLLTVASQLVVENMNPNGDREHARRMLMMGERALGIIDLFAGETRVGTNALVFVSMNSTNHHFVQGAHSVYVDIMQEDSLPFTRQLIDRIGWGEGGLSVARYSIYRRIIEVAGQTDDPIKEAKRKEIRLFLLEALAKDKSLAMVKYLDEVFSKLIPNYCVSIQRENALNHYQTEWPHQIYKDYGKAELELLKAMPASQKVDLLNPDTVVWNDGFDSLPSGAPLVGVNGWKGWDNQSASGAFSSGVQKHGGSNSVAIAGNSDFVHAYTGCTTGTWVYTAWQFVPTDFSGTQYFILLNTYNDNGPYNWSVQVSFDAAQNKVISDFDGANLPLVKGQWKEIRVEINLTTDVQTFYYGGIKLYQKSWSAGLESGGARAIAGVDLFANGASPVYYDDIALTQRNAP